jgi:hypothetical protein
MMCYAVAFLPDAQSAEMKIRMDEAEVLERHDGRAA